jgi:hypothetical protein
MLNQFKNVLDWRQTTKLFGAIRSVYSKKTSADLDHLAIEQIKICKLKAEQERAKTTVFLLRQTFTT